MFWTKRQKWLSVCGVALSLMGLLLALPVIADDVKDGEIAVGGEMLMRIRVPAEGKSVKERADEITDRLPVILGLSQLKPNEISVVKASKNTAKIMVRKQLLVTVTPEDGKANGLTTMQQAQSWLKNLRRILPRVTAQPNPNLQDGS